VTTTSSSRSRLVKSSSTRRASYSNSRGGKRGATAKAGNDEDGYSEAMLGIDEDG
jgi:hypothetical protein